MVAARCAEWPSMSSIFYDRQVAGAVVEPVRKEFHLTDTEIGGLNFAFTMLYGLVGLPLGLLADRVSRKKLLAVGHCHLGAAHGERALDQQLFFSGNFNGWRVGVGEATAAPTATSLDRRSLSRRRPLQTARSFHAWRSRRRSVELLPQRPLSRKNWDGRRHACCCRSGAGVNFRLLLMLHEPVRGASEKHRAPGLLNAGSIWAVYACSTFWWIAISGRLVNFTCIPSAHFFRRSLAGYTT